MSETQTSCKTIFTHSMDEKFNLIYGDCTVGFCFQTFDYMTKGAQFQTCSELGVVFITLETMRNYDTICNVCYNISFLPPWYVQSNLACQ